MNCIILHGMSSYLEDSFGINLSNRIKNMGFNILLPHFPLNEKITLEKWENIAKEYSSFFNNSLVICHSLSTLFILKFLRKYNLSCKALITIAGGYSNEIENEKYIYLKDFIPTIQDFSYAKNNIMHRFSLYSNNDHIFSQKQLLDYISLLDSKPIFLENCGHFGVSSGIKDIPEVEMIIKTIF